MSNKDQKRKATVYAHNLKQGSVAKVSKHPGIGKYGLLALHKKVGLVRAGSAGPGIKCYVFARTVCHRRLHADPSFWYASVSTGCLALTYLSPGPPSR